ncbi:MAG: hypothetical protein ACRCYY_15275 [Trueperaceae bacterium]
MKFIAKLSILGLILLSGLLVLWDDSREITPLATTISCDPVFFPPAADSFISDAYINADVGKKIGSDCASKKGHYFTLVGYIDWVPV